MTDPVRVAIVGGGVGGIVSVKHCLEEGLVPVCFEQHDKIGGLWYYTETSRPNQGAAIYPTLITNTSKTVTEFSDFPMPAHYPPYLPHDLMYEYIQSYTNHFRLRDYFRLNTRVLKIVKSGDHDETGNWDVTVRYMGKGDRTATETFQYVIIASGINARPFTPDIPGADEFQGEKVHSRDFRRGEYYRDKRVIVIGNANSAGDVAADISHHAKQVYMSLGRGTYIIARLANRGIPIDMIVSRFLTDILPTWLRTFVLRKLAFDGLDHDLYNITPEEPNPFKSPHAVNDELAWRISCGKILPKSYVIGYTQNGARFDDGSEVDDVDAVVYATGYKVDFGYLEDGVLCESPATSPHDLQLYKRVWPTRTKHNTLALVGMVFSSGSTSSVIEMQCRWIARVFAEKLSLPDKQDMQCDLLRSFEQMRREFGQRYADDNLTYKEKIADIIGVRPKFWRQLMTNPALAFKCYFGPALPVHYRLNGPHAWEGARRTADVSYSNTFAGLKTRTLHKPKKRNKRFVLIMVLCTAVLLGVGMRYYGQC